MIFSSVLGVVDGRRRFDQMSLPRVAAWGAAGGALLAATFVGVRALTGDAGFISNLLVIGPVFSLAAAGSAAVSLTLARKGYDQKLPEPNERTISAVRSEGATNTVGLDGQ